MRKKEQKLVVTFHTTAEAIAMERLCKIHKIDGRMIPVPRELSAACGLAWACESDMETKIAKLMQENNIEHEGIIQMMY